MVELSTAPGARSKGTTTALGVTNLGAGSGAYLNVPFAGFQSFGNAGGAGAGGGISLVEGLLVGAAPDAFAVVLVRTGAVAFAAAGAVAFLIVLLLTGVTGAGTGVTAGVGTVALLLAFDAGAVLLLVVVELLVAFVEVFEAGAADAVVAVCAVKVVGAGTIVELAGEGAGAETSDDSDASDDSVDSEDSEDGCRIPCCMNLTTPG